MLHGVEFSDGRDPVKPGSCGLAQTETTMPPETTALRSLGARLKAVRRARRLSLAEVSEATDVSASFLSLVENDKSDISIGRLVRLIEFYGISIADLLPGEGVSGAYPDVVSSTARRRLHSQSEGIDVYLLTSMTRDRQMMPMLVEIEPGARLAEHGRHPGEEWVHVLDGRLRLELDGGEPRILHAGDSAYYPSERPHLFVNDDAHQPLRLICVDTPPTM
jgi:quercetin dioxygenase-like cupin family protein